MFSSNLPHASETSFFVAFTAAAARSLPCIPQKPLRLVFSGLTRSDSRSRYAYCPFACGLCHARLRHFFRDAGSCRFAGFLLAFLLHRTSTMTSPPEQCSSIQHVPRNPCQIPPQLARPSSSRPPPKLKAQAQPRQLARTRTSRIALSRGTHQPHRTRLHVLNMKRALKGVQLQSSAPKLDQRQTRLRVKKSLKLLQLRKAFQAVVAFGSSPEHQTETRRRFSGVQVQHWGSAQKRDRHRPQHRGGRRNTFLFMR